MLLLQFTKAFPHPEIFIQYNLKPTVLHPSIMALSFIIIVYDYSFDDKNLNCESGSADDDPKDNVP